MEPREVFETLQRIETKLDTSIAQSQTQINSKVSMSLFKWIISFVIGGMITLGGVVATLNTRVAIMQNHSKHTLSNEYVGGTTDGITRNTTDPGDREDH